MVRHAIAVGLNQGCFSARSDSPFRPVDKHRPRRVQWRLSCRALPTRALTEAEPVGPHAGEAAGDPRGAETAHASADPGQGKQVVSGVLAAPTNSAAPIVSPSPSHPPTPDHTDCGHSFRPNRSASGGDKASRYRTCVARWRFVAKRSGPAGRCAASAATTDRRCWSCGLRRRPRS